MGKKKQRKKRRKVLGRMEKWIDRESWATDEIMAAGLATLAEAARKKDKKRFVRTVKDGRKFMDHFFGRDDSSEVDTGDAATPSEPVISYAPVGGGWYSIAIDGFEVDKLKGEATAAERAGDLLEAYAATGSTTPDQAIAVNHTGGGWYEAVVNGVPVGRYRGKNAVPERFAEYVATS